MIEQYFSVASSVVLLISLAYYAWDMIVGGSKPQRVTWFLFALISYTFLAAQIVEGSKLLELIFTLFNSFNVTVIFLLSLRYGVGGSDRRDKVSLLVVALSLILWAVTKDPLLSLFIILFIDGIGVGLTLIKTWKQPSSEPILMWSVSSIGALLGIFAIESHSVLNSLFPTYIFIADALVVAIILLAKHRGAAHV